MAIIDPFAESIYIKSYYLKQSLNQKNKDLTISKSYENSLRESISVDIRKYADLIPPTGQSEAASKLAHEKGINLGAMTWNNQTNKKFDPSRKQFHFEHFNTVFDIRSFCLDAKTLEEIKNILSTKTKIVWILKEEDKRLTALGYQRHRPDPEAAYLHSGIVLKPLKKD